ncbi:MAG: hypothetical protein JWN78_3230, partial [Bacteroidota bacterium]|nr:hypothetical protein [Bacteroidota bacterium]
MKKSLLLLIISISIFSCKKENTVQKNGTFEYTGALGDIEHLIHEDSMTVAEIQAALPAQILSLVSLKNSIRIFTVEYKTVNQTGDTIKASGIIIVPKVDSFAVPIVSYQHGTVLQRSDAPSFGMGVEVLLNIAFASEDGVVACVPDYIGLGTGDGLHLYLNPWEEANSVRDIMRCARKLVKQRDLAQLNGQVFLYGYSQGGHATMAAQRQLEKENADEFKLTASAPMAGPYCLSRTSQFNVMLDSVFYPNPF